LESVRDALVARRVNGAKIEITPTELASIFFIPDWGSESRDCTGDEKRLFEPVRGLERGSDHR
jgi:hypothetical protein